MYFIENITPEKKRTIKTNYQKHLNETMVLNENSEVLEVKITKSIWNNCEMNKMQKWSSHKLKENQICLKTTLLQL